MVSLHRPHVISKTITVPPLNPQSNFEEVSVVRRAADSQMNKSSCPSIFPSNTGYISLELRAIGSRGHTRALQ